MKHYDLDKIEPLLIRCKEYVVVMSNWYKRQGIDMPREVRELKHDLTEMLNKITK